MRKPRKAHTRSENHLSDSLIAAELLERRYALTATPLFDQFTSAAMEAVASFAASALPGPPRPSEMEGGGKGVWLDASTCIEQRLCYCKCLKHCFCA